MASDIIIRKQKFKIKTSGEQQALQVRRVINDQLQYKVLQAYNDALSGLDEDIYADKIVINLGKLTLPQLSTLPERIKEEIMKQFQRGGQLHEMTSTSFAEKMSGKDTGNSFSAEEMKKPESRSIPGEKQTDDVSAIIYFLEKGIYPWWYSGKKQKLAELLQSFSPSQMERLLLKIIGILKSGTGQKSEFVKARFGQQLTTAETFEAFMLSYAALQSSSNIRQNINLLAAKETVSQLAAFFSLTQKKYQQELAVYLLDIITEDREPGIKDFLLALKKNTQEYFRSNEPAGEFKNTADSFTSAIKNKLQQLNPDLKSILKDIMSKGEATAERGKEGYLVKTNNDKAGSISLPDQIKQTDNFKKKKQEPGLVFQEEEAIYISNAGMVILHPFFAALFKELDLLDEKDQFISAVHCHRAVVLLHYLQTGNEEYEEQHLAFSKIICGMKPEDILPDDIIPAENEKAECDQLLDIVIGYWEALKGASREALRETFFTRNGKLSFKNEIYLLQVERNATDILIDRLPWGMGIVKFPWLGYLIHVEW